VWLDQVVCCFGFVSSREELVRYWYRNDMVVLFWSMLVWYGNEEDLLLERAENLKEFWREGIS
jgi:hypothetical protein